MVIQKNLEADVNTNFISAFQNVLKVIDEETRTSEHS